MPTPTLMEQPQVAAEAVIGKEVSPGAVTPASPEQLLAVRLRDEIAKDLEPKKIVEGIAPHPAPNAGEIHKINNESIGITRFDTGTKAGEKNYATEPRSDELRKKAEVASRVAREILNKGYDGIKDDDLSDRSIIEHKTAVQKKKILRDACMVAVRSWPEGKAVFDSLPTDNDRIAKIEELFLKNPNALKLLSERFGEVYNEGAIPKDLVSLAQDEFDRADKINTAKAEALQALKDRLQKIEDGEKEFLPGKAKYIDLMILRGASAGWEASLRKKNEDIAKLERELSAAYPKGSTTKEAARHYYNGAGKRTQTDVQPVEVINSAIEAQIVAAEARLGVLRSEVEDINTSKDKLKGYEDELNGLNKERNDLKTAEVPLIEDSANAELAYRTAKRNLDIQKAARAVDEEKFVNDVTGMFQEAATRYMKQEVGRYEDAQGKIAAKESATAQKGDEANIMKWMENVWRKEGKNGKRNKVNKDEVKADYDHMLGERNVDSLIKEFMEPSFEEIEAKYGAGSIEAQEERRRLDDRYKDEAFMQKMGGIVTERLLRNYFEAGGKPEAGDIRVLSETPWGIAAINNAIAKNTEADQAIEKIIGKGKSKSEFISGLMKNPNTYKAGVSLLALLFGAPFLALGASALYGGYAAVGNAVGASGGPLF